MSAFDVNVFKAKIASGRVPCIVPFCGVTMAPDAHYSEMICAKHWKNVRLRTRRYAKLAERRAKKTGTREDWLRADSAWVKLKDEAVIAAAFI